MTATRISREQLGPRLAGNEPPLLIDVLNEEDFLAAHIPGARNACVFNVTFLDDVKKLAPDLDSELVVYGSSERSLASATAVEKLLAAGYTRVADYRGGLEDWRDAGGAVEGDSVSTPGEMPPADGRHPIDLEKSSVGWTGRNLTGAHSGTIRLSEGHIEIRDGRLVGGGFTLNMESIENSDIGDSAMRKVLLDHLKSDDFFDVTRFPEATFSISEIAPLADVAPGVPNHRITGVLTLKSVTREIVFPAILGTTPDGLLAADAHFDIDRTRWNVIYGSGKFYEKLGKHLVNDEISLSLKLITLPK